MLKPVIFFCSFPHAPRLICQQILMAQSSKQTQPLLTTSTAAILVHATRISGFDYILSVPILAFLELIFNYAARVIVLKSESERVPFCLKLSNNF